MHGFSLGRFVKVYKIWLSWGQTNGFSLRIKVTGINSFGCWKNYPHKYFPVFTRSSKIIDLAIILWWKKLGRKTGIGDFVIYYNFYNNTDICSSVVAAIKRNNTIICTMKISSYSSCFVAQRYWRLRHLAQNLISYWLFC